MCFPHYSEDSEAHESLGIDPESTLAALQATLLRLAIHPLSLHENQEEDQEGPGVSCYRCCPLSGFNGDQQPGIRDFLSVAWLVNVHVELSSMQTAICAAALQCAAGWLRAQGIVEEQCGGLDRNKREASSTHAVECKGAARNLVPQPFYFASPFPSGLLFPL